MKPSTNFSLNLLPQLFAPLCDKLCCGLILIEIFRDDIGDPHKYVGKFANQFFCEPFSLSEGDILEKELPESLCQALTLPAILREFSDLGTTLIHKELLLGADRRPYTLQAHLPCPELLTLAIQDAQPNRTMLNSQAEMILANLGDSCVVIDKNFTVCYENEAAKTLWGSTCGKTCYSSYHVLQSPCESCHVVKVFADGNIHKNEKLSRIKGTEHYLEITSAPLKDDTGTVTAVVNITHDVTSRKMTEKGKEHLIRELQSSLAKTKRLNGLLPICSHCKKIKDDSGVWHGLESYLRSHAEVEFSHGICQECGEQPHLQASPPKKD